MGLFRLSHSAAPANWGLSPSSSSVLAWLRPVLVSVVLDLLLAGAVAGPTGLRFPALAAPGLWAWHPFVLLPPASPSARSAQLVSPSPSMTPLCYSSYHLRLPLALRPFLEPCARSISGWSSRLASLALPVWFRTLLCRLPLASVHFSHAFPPFWSWFAGSRFGPRTFRPAPSCFMPARASLPCLWVTPVLCGSMLCLHRLSLSSAPLQLPKMLLCLPLRCRRLALLRLGALRSRPGAGELFSGALL